jgi:hypothetical protein
MFSISLIIEPNKTEARSGPRLLIAPLVVAILAKTVRRLGTRLESASYCPYPSTFSSFECLEEDSRKVVWPRSTGVRFTGSFGLVAWITPSARIYKP